MLWAAEWGNEGVAVVAAVSKIRDTALGWASAIMGAVHVHGSLPGQGQHTFMLWAAVWGQHTALWWHCAGGHQHAVVGCSAVLACV